MRSWLLSLTTASLLIIIISYGSDCAASARSSSSSNQEADNDAIVWGGEHIEMRLTTTGGTLSFDCASGTLAKPLSSDSQGQFRAIGTYTQEKPGPISRDGNPATNAAYSGSIIGGTMRLHIVSGTNKEVVGDFVLIRGKSGHVMKCK